MSSDLLAETNNSIYYKQYRNACIKKPIGAVNYNKLMDRETMKTGYTSIRTIQNVK